MVHPLWGRGAHLWDRVPKPVSCLVSRERSYEAQHRPEMASASRHDEEVPQLMEPKRPGYEVRTLEPVELTRPRCRPEADALSRRF
jgi:hypothetical protein